MSIAREVEKRLEIVTLSHILEEDPWTAWNRASGLGWIEDCKRKLILHRLHPEKATSTIERQRRFDEGHKQEKVMRQDMVDAGFTLRSTKGKPLYNEHLRLKGEVDDILIKGKFEFPVDYKTCSSHMFPHISKFRTADEMRGSKFVWVRHYPAQMYAYLSLYKLDAGVLIFKDKDKGVPFVLDAPADKIYFEMLTDGLHEINTRVAKKDIPAAVLIPGVCKYCDFEDYCFADSDRDENEEFPDEVLHISAKEDPELLQMMTERDEVEVAHKKFEKLDKAIKAQLRGKAPIVIIDDTFRILTTIVNATGYDIPAHIKKEFAYAYDQRRMKIARIKRKEATPL